MRPQDNSEAPLASISNRPHALVEPLKTVILTEIIAPYRIPVFNALARRTEIDLHVFFLAETDKALREWRIYKDEIRFSYDVLSSWRGRNRFRNLLLNRGLGSALDNAHPKVVICGGYNHIAFWQALWWTRRRKVRFVLWTESNQGDSRSQNAGFEWLKRYFVRSCDGFVVPGKSAFAYVKTLGACEKVIYTAPNAVDNAFFAMKSENVKEDSSEFQSKMKLPRRFILFVGRLVPEKGVFDLIEAYAKLGADLRSEVGLVFAGGGISRQQLEQRGRLISPGNVCFPGFAHPDDLAALYGLAELLVLPTHSDPWGLVVNEAMACGLPVIVSAIAGCASDLVTNGWNGFTVFPRDVEKLSWSLNSILCDAALRQNMSDNSRERIRDYSPEACAAGLAAAATAGPR